MFSYKNKLDPYLSYAIQDRIYNNFRVIIICRTLLEKIEKKIRSMKCELIHTIPSINCISAVASPRAINRLLEYPEVKYIVMDKYALICGSAYDSITKKSLNEEEKFDSRKIKEKTKLNKLKIDKDSHLTGKNIGIGIVDTGVYPHTNLISGKNKIRKFVDLINNYHYPYDDNGHGTFMSGIICGSKSKASGIAQESHIFSIKAFNSFGKGFISDVLYAIHTLIDESEESNIKVICLPFETLDYDKNILSLFKKLFNKACEKKIVVIVPSGNNTNEFNSMTGIALLENCITVGGLYNNKKVFKYSACGNHLKLKKPNVSALCDNICSLNCNIRYIPERNSIKLYPPIMKELYTYYSGTSCASAYISGICALLYEHNPNLSLSDILSLLKLSSTPIDSVPRSYQGAGIVEINNILC